MEESQVIQALGALAQETRLRIVRHLVECGTDGAPAAKIGEAVDASSSRLSFHLSALEHASIVSSQRVSRSIIYRVNFEQVGGLISYLLHDCCQNHPTVNDCCNGLVHKQQN